MTDLATNPGIADVGWCDNCNSTRRSATDLSPMPPGGPWYYLHSEIDCLRHVLDSHLSNIRGCIKDLDQSIREAHRLPQRY